MEYKTKNFFQKNVLQPYMHYKEIYEDKTHPEYDNLMYDLELLDEREIDLFYQEHQEKMKLDDNPRLFAKFCLLDEKISSSIAEDRLNHIKNSKSHPDLKDLVDKDNLISLNEFDKYGFDKFMLNNNSYSLCLPLNAYNSAYWISNELTALNPDISIKIFVDPFIKNFENMSYKSTIHSDILKWDEFKNLKNSLYGQFNSTDGLFKPPHAFLTEYVWEPRGNDEIRFVCEELPDPNFINQRGSRFVHAYFNKRTGEFTHFDGSIRIFSEKEIYERMNYEIKDEDRKIGKKIKLFEVENNIPKEKFIRILSAFFYWNCDLIRYINSKSVNGKNFEC